jgi:hypothetical protein
LVTVPAIREIFENMAKRASALETQLIDVLDRILDKGIVIDAWARFSIVGIDLMKVDARMTVASISTYDKYAEPFGDVALAAPPETT